MKQLLSEELAGLADSGRPPEFTCSRDRSYWHGIQEITLRAAALVEIRGTNAFLVFDNTEVLLCDISETDRPWYGIWIAATACHPELHQERRYYHP